MFINFFKSSFFSQYLIIAITGMFLWMSAFITPPEMPAPDSPVPLYNLVYFWLNNYPFVATLLGFILILTETYFLATMFSRHELVLKNSSLSALVFFVLMSFLPDNLTLTPVNIAVGFMIMILYQILIYYNKPEHLDRVFVAGLFTSIAGFFYLPFIIWFAFVIISLLLCSAASWRAWMAAFIGLATPLIYMAVWAFWHNEFIGTIDSYIKFFSRIVLFPNPFNADFYILGSYTLIVAFWGILFYRKGADKVVEIRAKSNVLLWTIFFVIASFLFSGSMAVYHIALAIPALTMVTARTLTGLKKTKVAEVILLIYFFSVLLNNLFIHNLFYR
ncbi:MAG: DUF6427 family protein [Bacteroidota bacterium]